MPPATPVPYTGCPHCTAYWEHRHSLDRIRPLPVLAVDPDGIDWSYHYWGYGLGRRSKRRAIVRPLPRSITNRIPLELFEHILDFLRWHTLDLYNCALVCSAWHRYSQRLLYSRVKIESRAAYHAVAKSSLRSGRSREYLTGTNSLAVGVLGNTPPGQREYFTAVPIVLGRPMTSLTCLILYSVRGPYHPSFIRSLSEFSALVHLTLKAFELHSFFDLRSIICGLKTLRELDLVDGKLVSRAPTAPSGYPPVNAPRLSKVAFSDLDDILLSQLAQWVTSTEICHGCRSLSLLGYPADSPEQRRCAELIVRKLGPSLDSLENGFVYWLQPHDYLSFLAYCTRLSTLELGVMANLIDSWQGLVTGLHELLSHCSSPVMRTLHVRIWMSEGSPSTSTHPDSEFWTIDLRSIHDIMKHPLFDSLQDASILLIYTVRSARLTCDTVLTAEEMERRLRLILEPWDKRGILTVEGYKEDTDEELRLLKAEDASNAEEGDSSAGAGGEEAQSSKDEILLASDQEVEDGREGAV